MDFIRAKVSFDPNTLAPASDTYIRAQSESPFSGPGELWMMQQARGKSSTWNITAGPITGPTAVCSFLGRKGVALSQDAKVLAANSLDPKSAWV